MTAPPTVARVLVVANRTPSTPQLLEELTRRRHAARFTLLIPADHRHGHTDWTAEQACELLERAAGTDVAVLDAGHDALDTAHEAVGDGQFDEIIVNTPEEHLTRLVHHDLTRRLQKLGLPVLVIPPEPDMTVGEFLKSGLPGELKNLD